MAAAAPLYLNAPAWLWHWLFWGGIVLMVLMIADSIVMLLWGGRIGFWPATLVNIGILTIVAGIILQTQGHHHSSVAQPSTEPPAANEELTLRKLFRNELGEGGYRFISDWDFDLKEGDHTLGRYSILVGIYGNFEAKSVYLGFFVPATDNSFKVIKNISSTYQYYLDESKRNFAVWSAPRGDNSQITNRDLIFTKQICIYHETIFGDEQRRELESMFLSQGIDPIFRGFGYLRYRQLEQQARKPATNPPGASPPTPVPPASPAGKSPAP